MVKSNSATPAGGKATLGRFLNAPGGIDKGAAVQAAEQKLQSLRLVAKCEVSDRIERLGILIDRAGAAPDPALCVEIFASANSIYSVVGTFGGNFLGRVSHSLCSLLDQLSERGEWNQEAVGLHFQALQLPKLQSALPRAEQEKIIVGLEQVTEKVLVGSVGAVRAIRQV